MNRLTKFLIGFFIFPAIFGACFAAAVFLTFVQKTCRLPAALGVFFLPIGVFLGVVVMRHAE